MDKFLKHQIIETIEDNYIAGLRNKYTGFVGVKMIDLFHHLMDIYRKITETDLRENQKTFDEALNATMPVDKYLK